MAARALPSQTANPSVPDQVPGQMVRILDSGFAFACPPEFRPFSSDRAVAVAQFPSLSLHVRLPASEVWSSLRLNHAEQMETNHGWCAPLGATAASVGAEAFRACFHL